MGIILRLDEIRERAAAIRLPQLELSRLSGISRDTIKRDNDTRLSSLEKLTEALVGEEQKMLRYLLALHSGSVSR